MSLIQAEEGKEYIIQQINTDDEELNAFLFSLGCYAGEPITVVSHIKGGCIVSIKDGRYNLDNQLAEAIVAMLTDAALREKYAQKSRERILDFAPEKITEDWIRVIEA